MKQNSTLCYIAAALFYINAILKITGSGGFSSGVIWLCLGSAFLCLGAAAAKKNNSTDKDKDSEQK